MGQTAELYITPTNFHSLACKRPLGARAIGQPWLRHCHLEEPYKVKVYKFTDYYYYENHRTGEWARISMSQPHPLS